MILIKRVARAVWELAHTLDGVCVSWRPFSVHIHPVRWEDRA